MKTNKTMQAVVVGVLVVSGGFGFVTRVRAGAGDQGMDRRPRPAGDSVTELKIQDSAFALLVETYREYKSCEIEKNYHRRLEAVRSLPKGAATPVFAQDQKVTQKLQDYFGALAKAERELQMEEVQTQVVNWGNAYNHMRQADEERHGQTVPNTANRRTAAEQLKSFVIVASGTVKSSSFNHGASIPAEAVLMDADEVAPAAEKIIQFGESR